MVCMPDQILLVNITAVERQGKNNQKLRKSKLFPYNVYNVQLFQCYPITCVLLIQSNANFSSWCNLCSCSLKANNAIFKVERRTQEEKDVQWSGSMQDAEKRQEGSYLCGIAA